MPPGRSRLYIICPSVGHASDTRQLQANLPVAGARISPGKSIRRAKTAMGSYDLLVGEDNMVGLICQRHNWQRSRCGSIAFGSYLGE